MLPVGQPRVVDVSEPLTVLPRVCSGEVSPVPLPPGGRRRARVRGHRAPHLGGQQEPPVDIYAAAYLLR